jgi:hypothetical protein
MNNSNLSNQELLKELERKAPNFNQEEIFRLLELTMFNLPRHYREKLLSLNSQQTYDHIQESIRQVEQEKKDREQVRLIKEFFSKAKENEEKPTFNCQECQAPIKLSPPDEKGRQVFEFYGK